MITIVGNVGNAGFALPMTQAYPLDPNLQWMLAWNPTQQALDYVPYSGNVLGDFGVVRDLSVGRDVAIARDLAVARNTVLTGTLAVSGVATIPQLTGNMSNAAGNLTLVNGNFVLANAGSQLTVGANKVVGARATGWAAMTGTPLKTTFATGTVTLPQLAGIVMALQADLIAHGLIGA